MSRMWKIVLLLLAAAALGLPVAAPHSDAATTPAQVSPRSYDFGNVRVGSTKSKVITLSIAKGYALSDYKGSGTSAPYGVAALSAGCSESGPTTCKVTEIFRPTTLAPDVAAETRFTICPVLIGDCTTYRVSFEGTGTPPGHFSTGGISFGTVAIGKETQKLVKLTIDPGYTMGTLHDGTSDVFRAAPTGPCTQTCEVAVRFRPTTTGKITGDLTADLCPATGPDPCVSSQPVLLTGAGSEAATVSAKSISFGTRAIGSTTTKTFSLKIAGDWHLSSAELLGDDLGSRFTMLGDNFICTGAPGPGTCTTTVSFTPWYVDNVTGRIELAVCSPTNPDLCREYHVALSGKGSLPGAVSSTTVSFGDVTVGQQGTKTVRVGKVRGWHVVDVFFGDEPDSPFSSDAVDSCAHDVGAQECFFPVTFDPVAIGDVSTEMTVTMCRSADSAEPCVDLKPVKVSGSGKAPGKANVTTVSFGNVHRFDTVTKTFTVNPDPGWIVAALHGDGNTQEGGGYSAELGAGCATADTVCTIAQHFRPVVLGVQHATTLPYLCQVSGSLCVELPGIKLSGKGI